MLGAQLIKLGIKKVRRSVNGERSHYYMAEYKDLLSLFKKKMWIHESDEICDDNDKKESDLEKKMRLITKDLEDARKRIEDMNSIINDLKKENQELKTDEESDDGLNDDDAFERIGLDEESDEEVEEYEIVEPEEEIIINKTDKSKMVTKNKKNNLVIDFSL